MRHIKKRLAFFMAVALSVTAFMASATDTNFADYAAENLNIGIPFTTYSLDRGESKNWEVPLGFTTMKPKADIVYVTDATGSMYDAKDMMSEVLAWFAEKLMAAGATDLQFGAAHFTDRDVDRTGWFGFDLPLGKHSIETVQDALVNLPTKSNGNPQADGLMAYMRTIDEAGWRPDAERIVVLFFDSPMKEHRTIEVGGYPITAQGATYLTMEYGVKPAILPRGPSSGYNMNIPNTVTADFLVSFLGVPYHAWTDEEGLKSALVAAVIPPSGETGSYYCEARVESIAYASDGEPSADVTAVVEPPGFTVNSGEAKQFELSATARQRPGRLNDVAVVEIGFYADGERIGSATQKLYFEAIGHVVTFVDWDGAELKSELVPDGGAAVPPEPPPRDGWAFTGWDKAYHNIIEDITVGAQYGPKYYTVDFVDWNGMELKTEQVQHGGAATAPAEPGHEGLAFLRWDKDYGCITSDLVVTAVYDADYYTVVFQSPEGTELKKEQVIYGGAATAPAPPARAGWAFTGWDKAFNYITEDLTVTAQYKINTYTVDFLDWNGSLLKRESVPHGGDATAPAYPSRVGWAFTGWDKAFNNITSDLAVNAQYAINGFTVDFVDYDGTKLKSEPVPYGGAATPPADPSREGWSFTGWDKAFGYITENLTVTAQYNAGFCKVDFLDWDGKLLKTQDVPYGGAAAAPAAPSRAGWTFTGWDKAFDRIVEDTAVAAQYKADYCLAVFEDWDNAVIHFESVPYGGAATAPADPSRAGWSFVGWDKAFDRIVEDTTVTALYAANYSTVEFVDWNGSLLKRESVPYGGAATAPADPSRAGWAFAGWDKAFDKIMADLVVTARYVAGDYAVRFVDWDGKQLKEQPVQHGGAAAAPADPSRAGWTFAGWDKAFNNITSDLTVAAQYKINNYTVVFVDWDGNLLKAQQASYEGAAAAPASPSRAGWTFTGWDKAFNKITADIVVTALYDINEYTVGFVDWDGTLLKTQQVPYGGAATAPSDPSRAGRSFTGWDKAYGYITSNLTVTALYDANYCNVVFQDWDGKQLKSQTVPYGGAAAAPADPSRVGWTFNEWDKGFGHVISDLIVTARYTINHYNVVFQDWDGNRLKTQPVPYGGAAAVPADPSRAGWTFTGWDKEYGYITADLFVTAGYRVKYYLVAFKGWDGSELKRELVPYEGAAMAPAGPSRAGWAFTGWDKAYDLITSDLVVNAQYEIDYYNVVFLDWDGMELKRESVPYEGAAAAPGDPSRVGWAYMGWDKAFNFITEDLDVVAKYRVKHYTVVFEDWNGDELKRELVPYEGAAKTPAAPSRDGWTFTGWDKAFGYITENLVVTAFYDANDTT